MDWLEVKIYTNKVGIEVLTGILLGLGVTGFVVEDPDDYEEFMTYQGKTWDYMEEGLEQLKDVKHSIKFYLADTIQAKEIFNEIKNTVARLKNEEADYGSLEIELGNVKEEDWANNWKKYFHTFNVGEKFVIKPTWEEYDGKENRHVLEIDPSSSFGTGQHFTTRLCIERLENIVTSDTELLDMGCGSGILSIAAYLLDAKHVTSVDIDENSVNIARENFLQNNMTEDKFTLYCGDVTNDDELVNKIGTGKYDVVVANIVADVIIGMKNELKAFLKPNGKLIASGVITDRQDEVCSHLEEIGFKVENITEQNDWISILAHIEK